MSRDNVVKFLKNRLGISTNSRNEDLKSIVESILSELESCGIDTAKAESEISEFVIDCAFFRYSNRGEGELPKNLNRRLNNLIINYGKEDAESNL